MPDSGIALDSRTVLPGHIFVALKGDNTDGHRFIPDAIRRGAILVVGEEPLRGIGAPYIQVADSRLAWLISPPLSTVCLLAIDGNRCYRHGW
jgi:UDP-N-acetylmuramoyl-L-alanyl-D-glutamate--2,6-diaminopimelate ligase